MRPSHIEDFLCSQSEQDNGLDGVIVKKQSLCKPNQFMTVQKQNQQKQECTDGLAALQKSYGI